MGYADTKPRQKIRLNTFGFITKTLNKFFHKKVCYKSMNLQIPITVLFMHISCDLLHVPFPLIFFFFFNLLTRITCVPLITNITAVKTESIKSLAGVVGSITRLITDVCTPFSKGVARAIFAPRK